MSDYDTHVVVEHNGVPDMETCGECRDLTYPIGSEWEDCHGDIWIVQKDGRLYWELGDITRDAPYVEEEYGPLKLYREVGCYDCETAGYNCSAHRSPSARVVDEVAERLKEEGYYNTSSSVETLQVAGFKAASPPWIDPKLWERAVRGEAMKPAGRFVFGENEPWKTLGTTDEGFQVLTNPISKETLAMYHGIDRLFIDDSPQTPVTMFTAEVPEDTVNKAAASSGDDFPISAFNVYDESFNILLKKNADYGPNNIADSPGGPLNGILVRMWDKMSRLRHLVESGVEPENESLRDTLMDMANYSLIAMIVLDGNWPGMRDSE